MKNNPIVQQCVFVNVFLFIVNNSYILTIVFNPQCNDGGILWWFYIKVLWQKPHFLVSWCH